MIQKTKKALSRWHLPALLSYFKRANISMVGPTIAYYTFLSLVPLVMSIGAVAGVVGVEPSEINRFLASQLPTNVAKVLVPLVASILNGGVGILSFTIVVTLWSASSILATIRQVFNQVYDVENEENGLVTRIFSFVWMLVLLTAALVIIIASSILPSLVDALPVTVPLLEKIAQQAWLYAGLALLVLLTIFNFLLPAVKQPWQAVLTGSVIEIGLLLAVNSAFGYYAHFALKNVGFYQSLGSLVVLLIYFNLMASVLVLGQVIIAWLGTFKTSQ